MRLSLYPAWWSFHAPWLAGVAVVAMSCVFAAEIPPGDAPALGEEQIEALRTRKTVAATMLGYGIPPIPLRLMPDGLEFVDGKVSLVPDQSDSIDGRIAVYLINASDQAVFGADSNYAYCFLEVKDGNRWRACQRFIPGCGTGIPEPEHLRGMHATIFLGNDPNHGDMTGELRFCITIQHTRPIVSASFQGRFSSKQFEEAAPIPTPASREIATWIADMTEGKPTAGSLQTIARSPEEYIAAAELERSYDESSATKTALIRWQASVPSGEEMAPCRTALAALLKRPWDHHRDAPALFERCFSALTLRGGGDRDFGSPERCRAMVWRYLSEFRSEWLEVFINPERWDQLEAIRQSGNPWGVDQKLVAALVEEAIASLRAPDSSEREAAGTFLGGYWITQSHLPDERVWFVLDHDVASARKAAIAALARRGKGQQAGSWLVDHRDLPEQELATLWEAGGGRQKDFLGLGITNSFATVRDLATPDREHLGTEKRHEWGFGRKAAASRTPGPISEDPCKRGRSKALDRPASAQPR
ncbi:hypothetical protein OKA05_09860 [Luteolibacter arcticus]|uniref:Uncharacterized protein n=1 Tax=Luteolibacter arcticus TaxID=1581411 RepID=A0ABT3GGW1_9BACT|nr:hypothetical protein [Luteolibacter arcticus]MCW1922855.1 hypothetical protein [Luteolibacter arcticus]